MYVLFSVEYSKALAAAHYIMFIVGFKPWIALQSQSSNCALLSQKVR